MYHSIFVYWLLITLNERILVSIIVTHHDNLSVNYLYLMTFPLKPGLTLSNLTVAKKLQSTVFLWKCWCHASKCVGDTSTPLKEWSEGKVFSVKVGLYLSLHSVKDTENESIYYASHTLIAKGIQKFKLCCPLKHLIFITTCMCVLYVSLLYYKYSSSQERWQLKLIEQGACIFLLKCEI